MDDIEIKNLIAHIHELRRYMLENAIVSMTLKAKNICYQKRGSHSRLILVDSIGNSDYVKLCNYVKAYARLKMRRRWNKFIKRITKPCTNTKIASALLDKH